MQCFKLIAEICYFLTLGRYLFLLFIFLPQKCRFGTIYGYGQQDPDLIS